MIDLSDLLLNGDSSKQPMKMNSILTGIVKENYNDKFPGRVSVEMYLGEKGKTITEWIRVMQPYAGKDFGEYFIPEVGTEVVIGFTLGDINRPIVLGCLWNDVDKVPTGLSNKDNSIKKILTKGGHHILLDESKDTQKVEVMTKGKMAVILDDKNKKITIKDENGDNQIVINNQAGSIELTAKQKIVLKAGTQDTITINNGIVIKGQKISAEGTQDVILKGLNVKAQAQVGVELKASATLKAESSGIAEIKGAMVKIN